MKELLDCGWVACSKVLKSYDHKNTTAIAYHDAGSQGKLEMSAGRRAKAPGR